nr:MAG TPA: hypothetical protein [Caudoviricetes sp.]DAP90791.1 MAG TPA: hypothetical protein [Caudoviricetes sp.]
MKFHLFSLKLSLFYRIIESILNILKRQRTKND